MWNSVSGSGSVASRPVWTDVQLVTQAMHRLDQLEFEFFRSAWRDWYGTEPEDKAIEPGFMRYLFQQTAPTYVRHFARQILSDILYEETPARPNPLKFLAFDQAGDGGAGVATAGAAVIFVLCLVVLI